MEKFLLLTNNPLVHEKQPGGLAVEFLDTDYTGVLMAARDKIHKGALLLIHPLYGSVKPGETPYRSLLLREDTAELDLHSLELIESALDVCRRFCDRTGVFRQEADNDFRVIDYSLLMSGLNGFL